MGAGSEEVTEVEMRRDARRLVLGLGILLLPSATAVAEDKAAAIDSLLKRHHDVGAFNGAALVAENGKVIFKKGFGLADFEWKVPNAPDTKFRLGSITKQFTAVLILQLVEEGKLSLDTTLAKALPYYRPDTGARVTVHQLLSHTSGIPSYTSLPTFFRDVSRDPYEVKDFVIKYCSGDLEFEPGTTFRYDNSGYFLLGAILEQLTGKTYAEVLKERVLDPVGLRATGYDVGGPLLEKRARAYERSLLGVRNAPYLDMSLPYAAGALYSTVEDLYVWDQALYGETVLPKAAKERMFKPNLGKYAYGWGIDTRPIGPGKADRQTIGHGGGINGFSTLITRVPEDRNLVVLLNNTGGTNLDVMFAGIADILYGRTPAPVKEPVARALYETIEKSGVAAAAARYRELKARGAAEFDLTEGQLNSLGYELLQQKRNTDAIEVFKLNVEAFPESANTYDSLGEAYMKAGQKELAIKSYAKSLELNPGNRNAVDQLAALTK
jgi:CubicO group peptidase (beta-lactamase class C family)